MRSHVAQPDHFIFHPEGYSTGSILISGNPSKKDQPRTTYTAS
jgi:hypothetical protein